MLIKAIKQQRKISNCNFVVNSLNDQSVAEYASHLFSNWGIGSERYDNEGLLLLVPEEGKIRIEVGYGLEEQLTDSLTGAILDKYLALFSDNEFDYGTLEVFKTLVVKVNDYYDFPELATIPHYDVYRDVKEESHDKENSFDWGKTLGALFIIALTVIDLLSDGSSSGDSSRSSSGSSSGGSSFGGGSSGGGGSSRSFYLKK